MPLRLFLDFLRAHGACLNSKDYQDAEVVREEGKIDLLIRDKTSRRAIIIENKVNDAGDMPRQLPRYLEYVKSLGLTCDAIAYLRLNRHCDPCTHGWTDIERREIGRIIKVINAFDESKCDLLSGWICKCEEAALEPNTRFVFGQYRSLIRKIGENAMTKTVLSNFYALMREGANFQNAQAIRAMLEGLIDYRRDNIIDTFKADKAPFNKVGPWSNVALFLDLFWKEANLCVDVGVEPDGYKFHFWDRSDEEEGARKKAEKALKLMGRTPDFVRDGGGFTRNFKFPEEEDALFDYIRQFKRELAAVVSKSSN